MEPEGIHEQSAAYVLDALEDVERGEFEEHLGRCTVCEQELDSLRGAATSLAYAVAGPAPPPGLRERLLARARGTRQPNVVPLRLRALPLAATAAAACAAIGLGIWAATLESSLDRERSARRAEARALAIVTSPDATRFPLSGAKGAVLVTPEREAALVVSDLGPAPSGKTYEAWVIAGDEPHPAGIFPGGGGRTVVALVRRVPAGARVAVSLEPAGGVPRLTGPILFRALTA